MSRRRRKSGTVIRAARWSAEHPWRAVLSWVVFVALCVVAGGAAGTRTQTDSERAVGQWKQYQQLYDQGRFDDPAVENVLVTAKSGALDPVRAKAALAVVSSRFAALPEVRDVDPPLTAPHGGALLLRARMAGSADTADARVQPLLDATGAVAAAYPDLRFDEVGDASIEAAMNGVVTGDFGRAERLSLPITLGILIFTFGALIAAGVPVLLAMSSVFAAIGLAGLASHVMPVDDLLNSVILLIGMAVGVDYSLFYVRRAREERDRGATPLAAVEIAAATSGRAVVVSGCTVAVAMAGMFLSNAAIFESFAMGTILVVAVAVLGSITVLPALLAKLGRWVDRPRVPVVHRFTGRHSDRSRLWSALLRPALHRPALALTVGVGLLVGLALPALGMRTRDTSSADLPRSIPVVRSYDRLVAAFPSQGAEHLVAVRAPANQAAAVRTALLGLAARTRTDPLFAMPAQPDLRVSADHRITLLAVPIRAADVSPAAGRSLNLLRDSLVPAAVSAVPGATWAVGGGTAASTDFSNLLGARLPWIIAFVLTLTFLLMLWTFRSVVIAATAIGLNLLSVSAAYGLLVLVFQHTWAEGVLDFRSNGSVVTWLPMFLFVILFGLSMDYHVFVVSRIREAAMAGMPTREAVRYGVTTSAGAVTSAAVVMVGVFSIFGTLSLLEFKQMGVGLAAAILLDATRVRVVLLPAAMTLLGRWNWWAPEGLRRLLPAPSLESVAAGGILLPGSADGVGGAGGDGVVVPEPVAGAMSGVGGRSGPA